MGSMSNAVCYGCAGPELTSDERAFFRDADPFGFILFARNCVEPKQIRKLCADMRDIVGRANAPILIDQEGGRVQRLRPPHWRTRPPMRDSSAICSSAIPAPRAMRPIYARA